MNETGNRIKIQERIERYVRGELSEDEIDDLWVIFLDSPEWFDYFTTLLNLYSIGRSSTKMDELT